MTTAKKKTTTTLFFFFLCEEKKKKKKKKKNQRMSSSAVVASTTEMNEQLESLFRLFATHPGGGSILTQDQPTNHKLDATLALCAALLAKDAVVVPLSNRPPTTKSPSQQILCASYPPEVLLVVGSRRGGALAANAGAVGQPMPATNSTDDDDDSVRLEPADDDEHGLFELDVEDNHHQAQRQPEQSRTIQHQQQLSVESRALRDWSRVVPAARLARVRTRFPVPVLAYGDNVLCRSSTLAHKFEIMLNRSSNDVVAKKSKQKRQHSASDVDNNGNGDDDDADDDAAADEDESSGSGVSRARRRDIDLLKLARVVFICDLMVEDRKQVYGVNVCSSEKVDRRDRYGSFALASMPYPGCEYFREVAAAGGEARGLVPPWPDSEPSGGNKRFAELAPCALPSAREYRAFDLITLTQKYVKALLQLLAVGSVLCHCISGWDRTPLFVSLLRISLWADGAAHESLSVDEILYLTVAYDWMLFGHQLRDRVTRKEMVFTFCFDVLQHLESNEFSVDHADARRSASEASSSAPSQPTTAVPAAAPATGTTPIEIGSDSGAGSLGAASSWHVLDQERALSASSFDDNMAAQLQQSLTVTRVSRRAERLSELRLRFRSLFDKAMKPHLGKPAEKQTDFVQYSKQLWRLVAENR
jgi:hypothetical protein